MIRIHMLAVDPVLQPDSQPFLYPAHNNDYGVEQDFLRYVHSGGVCLVDNPDEADWHYLPVFWTRWHLNHDYGRNGTSELRQLVGACVRDDERTFTICQYDDGPVVDLGRATVFLASRKVAAGLDIPLLCTSHAPCRVVEKTRLATFCGRLSTHPIRQEMAAAVAAMPNVLIADGDFGTQYFVDRLAESYVALCPRGYGGSSFRLFEAMQLGVVPFLVGDIDTRPFKQFVPWSECSFFSQSADQIQGILEAFETADLLEMGRRAHNIWRENLSFQRWCRFVALELEAVG